MNVFTPDHRYGSLPFLLYRLLIASNGLLQEFDIIFAPGAPLTYFNDGGGGPKDSLGLTFWPKGIFLGL